LELVELEAHSLKLMELQDQFQHLDLLHLRVVGVQVPMLEQVLLVIILVQLEDLVVEELLDVVEPQEEQVIHLLSIRLKVVLEVILLTMLVVRVVELQLLDKQVNQEQVELEVQEHLMQLQELQHLMLVVVAVVVEPTTEKMEEPVELVVVELDLQMDLVPQELQTLEVVEVVALDVILIVVEQVVQVLLLQEHQDLESH
tara:strand:- start:26 stop:625 length:600 start_codon:yes stop_codon:yes gene_type:complete